MPSLQAVSASPVNHARWADTVALTRATWTRESRPTETPAAPWRERFAVASQRLTDRVLQQETSALQQRQAALQQAADLVARMGELQALAVDPEAGEASRAAYETEFAEQQAQLLALTDAEGEPLFAGSALLTEEPDALEGDATETAAPAEFAPFRDDFSTAENWVSVAGALSVRDGTLYPLETGFGAVRSLREFSGPLEIQFDLFLPGAADSLELSLGGAALSNLTDSVNISKWEQRSVRIVYDGVDRAATYLDGAEEAVEVRTGLGELAGALGLENYGLGSARLRNFEINRPSAEATVALQSAAAAISAGVEIETDALALIAEAEELADVEAEALEAAMKEIQEQQTENAEALAALAAEPETAPVTDDVAAESLGELAAAEAAAEMAREEILLESAAVLVAHANLDERDVWALLG